VCFLCGSLCGLLFAALCGPLCGGPLLCGPLCGSFRRLLLAAFRSAFLRHSFSVICLSFAASAAVLSHMVHSELELLAQLLAHGPPHDHVDHDRPQPRILAAVVDMSPAQPHAWLLSGAGHTGAHARRITTSLPISRAGVPGQRATGAHARRITTSPPISRAGVPGQRATLGLRATLDNNPNHEQNSADMNIVGVPLCDTVNLGCSAAATRTHWVQQGTRWEPARHGGSCFDVAFLWAANGW